MFYDIAERNYSLVPQAPTTVLVGLWRQLFKYVNVYSIILLREISLILQAPNFSFICIKRAIKKDYIKCGFTTLRIGNVLAHTPKYPFYYLRVSTPSLWSVHMTLDPRPSDGFHVTKKVVDLGARLERSIMCL